MRKGVAFVLFIFLSIGASLIYAQVRINTREKSALVYDLMYMDAWGLLEADAKGVECRHSRLMEGLIVRDKNSVLPRQAWGEYQLFYPKVPIRYQIRLRNSGSRAYSGVRVVAWHRYLNPTGVWTQQMDAGKRDWAIGNLDAKQSIVLNGEFEIMETPTKAGLFQTFFQVIGRDSSRQNSSEEVMLEDIKPAAWCAIPESR